MAKNTDFDDNKSVIINELKEEVERRKSEINLSNPSFDELYKLFMAYKHLYNFTKHDKNGSLVDTYTIDEIADKLYVKIKNDIDIEKEEVFEQGRIYNALFEYYDYKDDNQNALACLDKMVMLREEAYLVTRAQFKKLVLGDSEGALADYNRALEVVTDADEISYIQKSIKTIDLFRDCRKTIEESEKFLKPNGLYTVVVWIALIFLIIDLIYEIFEMF